MGKLDGGCLCGAVRYTSKGDAMMTAVCHCKHCQKQTGTSFSIIVAVPKDGFTAQGEALAVFNDIGDSGKHVLRHFCRSCGSPLFTKAEVAADRIFIKAGTLDDPTWLKPQANIWCQSAQPWIHLDEGVPKFEKSPTRRS
jgi:hypothetical protein